jgi:hypothetical protein
LFIWFVLFVWFEERNKPNEPNRLDQPVLPYICAFSFNARLSSTIAKVSRAQLTTMVKQEGDRFLAELAKTAGVPDD